MSEPDAGSDVRGMKCSAVRDGDDFVINGTKHFISHADLADYVILFAASGEEETRRGPKKLITGFLVDLDTPGAADAEFDAGDGADTSADAAPDEADVDAPAEGVENDDETEEALS